MEIRWSVRCVVGLAILGVAAAKDKCPKGCKCAKMKNAIRKDGHCGATVTCNKLQAWPAKDEWPEVIDCLTIADSKELGKKTLEEKKEGLLNIPTTVRRIDFMDSCLAELPDAGFSHFKEVRFLNLEFNQLKVLPETLFHGMVKLKTLWLTGNHFNKEEDPKIYPMKKANGNKLSEIHPNQFKTLENLQVLLMHHNKIVTLPETLFEDQQKLRVLKLLDNKFKPALTRKHPAFTALLESKVLQQCDLKTDSGDSLEDYWDKNGKALTDEFKPGLLPKSTRTEM